MNENKEQEQPKKPGQSEWSAVNAQVMPLQPIRKDRQGVFRFKENAVVRYLLDTVRNVLKIIVPSVFKVHQDDFSPGSSLGQDCPYEDAKRLLDEKLIKTCGNCGLSCKADHAGKNFVECYAFDKFCPAPTAACETWIE